MLRLSVPTGERLEDAPAFDVHVAGTEANVTFDVNYRQRLWPPEAAATAVRSVAQLIDVLICTREDARDLFGAGDDPETAVLHVQAHLGVEVAVVTLGAEGAVAVRDGVILQRPGHPVKTIDRVGAGDAFAAGLIWGLADGSLDDGLERGLAMRALQMTLRGDLVRF